MTVVVVHIGGDGNRGGDGGVDTNSAPSHYLYFRLATALGYGRTDIRAQSYRKILVNGY